MWLGKYESDALDIVFEDNRVYDIKHIDTTLTYLSKNLPN